MENLYKEMYFTDEIKESTFENLEIPMDTDSKGNPVSRNNDISGENRHRAKVLTSEVQRNKRRKMVNEKRIGEYQIKKRLYDSEQKDSDMNKACEQKIIDIVLNSRPDIRVQANSQFNNIGYNMVQDYLTIAMLREHSSKVLSNELKSFIQVRSQRRIKQSKISYSNVPTSKDDLMKKCVEMRAKSHSDCLCEQPVYPSLMSIE